MDRRSLLLLPTLAAIVAALAGCQTGGNTALMERDLRLQEDRIYYLEDKLARLQKKHAQCCEENNRLQGLTSDATHSSAVEESPRDVAPPPPVRSPSGPDLSIPKIEVEAPSVPRTKPPEGGEANPSKIIRPGERRRQERDNTVSRPPRVSASVPRPAPTATTPTSEVRTASAERPAPPAAASDEKWSPSTTPIAESPQNEPQPADAEPATAPPQLKVSLPSPARRRPANQRWQPDR